MKIQVTYTTTVAQKSWGGSLELDFDKLSEHLKIFYMIAKGIQNGLQFPI